DIAAGIYYLHSQDPPIVHGDIRGVSIMGCQANILVTDDLRCCLADFGLSVISTESQAWTIATSSSFLKGAIHWLAPEYISPDTSPKAPHTSRDIYAFGCTIVEILTRKVPFHNCPSETAVLLSLLNGQRPTRPENVWCPDRLWGLAVQCWEQDSRNRPSAHAIHIILQR
ncbi:kinase-like domain-containing protein, partial [Rhodocollybia butyracea]